MLSLRLPSLRCRMPIPITRKSLPVILSRSFHQSRVLCARRIPLGGYVSTVKPYRHVRPKDIQVVPINKNGIDWKEVVEALILAIIQGVMLCGIVFLVIIFK